MDLRDNHPYLIGYYISNVGKIYSRVKGYWRELTPCINREGYLRIKLNGKQYSIHRLVALAYIPNPENKPCVCHKDNNKLNNSVDNLYWGTQKENLEQMIKDGRSLKGRRNPMWKNHYNSSYGRYGEKATASKLSNKDRISIVKSLNSGISIDTLSKRYKVSRACIRSQIRIVSNLRKQQ